MGSCAAQAAGTAEVSSQWLFLLPRPTAAHSSEGRKILMLLELPPIPGSAYDCFAGCEAQHQQTAFAKRKRHDVVFRVKVAAEEPVGGTRRSPVNSATHERCTIRPRASCSRIRRRRACRSRRGVFTKNIASCDFFLADIRRLVLNRPSGPEPSGGEATPPTAAPSSRGRPARSPRARLATRSNGRC